MYNGKSKDEKLAKKEGRENTLESLLSQRFLSSLKTKTKTGNLNDNCPSSRTLR